MAAEIDRVEHSAAALAQSTQIVAKRSGGNTPNVKANTSGMGTRKGNSSRSGIQVTSFAHGAQSSPSHCMTPESASAEDYQRAFLVLASQRQMTATRRKLLQVHYRFYHHQATMSQMAEAMGWKSFSSANVHYGRLGQLVGEELGFEVATGGAYSSALCTFLAPQEPGDHWLTIMRPQVAEALRELGWT